MFSSKKRIFLLLALITFISTSSAFAQSLKSKTTLLYYYMGQDSVLREKRVQIFDESGLKIQEVNTTYANKPQGDTNTSIASCLSFVFNPSKMTSDLSETYASNSTANKIIKAKYHKFTGNLNTDQIHWTKQYDNFGELVKEDTFAYDKSNRLVKKVSYNYSGSTSKYVYTYKYDRKGRLKRERLYYHYITVTMGGKSKEKPHKTSDYKYCYNHKGELTRKKGKYYDTKNDEKRVYVGNTMTKTLISKSKYSAGKDQKRIEHVNKTIEVYENNKLKFKSNSIDDKEQIRTECTLQDTMEIVRKEYRLGELLSETNRQYSAQQKVAATSYKEYRSGKVVNEQRISYDEKGNIKSFFKGFSNNVVNDQTFEYTYNQDEKKVSMSVTSKGKPDIKTQYIYDAQKNLIKEVTFDANSRIIILRKSILSYFK